MIKLLRTMAVQLLVKLILLGTWLLATLQNVPPIGAQGAVLSGEVRLPNGSPAAGVRVAALEAQVLADGDPAEASVLSGLAVTDANGRFRLEGIPPGRYFIVAGALNNLVYRPTAVTVSAGATIDGLDFSMGESYEGVVEVFVHLVGSAEPVPGVQVSIRTATAASPTTYTALVSTSTGFRSAGTNVDGIASFSGIPYGDYSVSTPAPTVRDLISGTAAAGGSGRELSLSVTINPDRPRWRVSLGVQRPVEIRGTVRDENGRPVADAVVEALETAYRRGRRVLVSESSTRTDSAGEYTLIESLGEHYIRVTPRVEAGGREIAAYYPGTGAPGNARPVVLSASKGVTGIDVTLPRTFAVSGTLSGTDSPPNNLLLVARDGFDMVLAPFENKSNTSGTFEITGVPAGSWDLFADIPIAATGVRQIGRIAIRVADKDLQGVALAVRAVSVEGRISAEASNLDLQSLKIDLVPRAPLPIQLTDALPAAQAPDAKGRFTFAQVPELEYGVQVNDLPAGWYVADIRAGGTSIFSDNVLRIGDKPLSGIEILLDSNSGRVEGTVAGISTNAQVALTAQVVLVPDVPQRENFLLYRTSPVRANGSFAIVPLPAPGRYKLFAVPRLPGSRAEWNTEFFAKYEGAAVPITVLANQTVRQDLELTSR